MLANIISYVYVLSSAAAVCVIILQPAGTAAASPFDDNEIELIKKTECVLSSGNCFNSEQCCAGMTCVAVSDRGDAPESPGQCVKGKELKECSSTEDCILGHGFSDDEIQCVPLQRSRTSGPRYCLHSSTPEGGISERSLTQMNGPRKHQLYARLLSNIAGSCDTDADCQSYAANNPGTRLCCQQVSQGRQGTRRICDRITAVSVCIPPRM